LLTTPPSTLRNTFTAAAFAERTLAPAAKGEGIG